MESCNQFDYRNPNRNHYARSSHCHLTTCHVPGERRQILRRAASGIGRPRTQRQSTGLHRRGFPSPPASCESSTDTGKRYPLRHRGCQCRPTRRHWHRFDRHHRGPIAHQRCCDAASQVNRGTSCRLLPCHQGCCQRHWSHRRRRAPNRPTGHLEYSAA